MKKGKKNTVKKLLPIAAVAAALFLINKRIESGNKTQYKDI